MTSDAKVIRSDQHEEKFSEVNAKPESEEKGFVPDSAESLPQLKVPDLSNETTSLPPEALANLPVLTLAVSETELPQDESQSIMDEGDTQEQAPQSESWVEVCQMRISNLTADIQLLHERLDRLEKRTKA
jgi:hypothetical protein